MSIRHRVKGFIKKSLKRVTRPQDSANRASEGNSAVKKAVEDTAGNQQDKQPVPQVSSSPQPTLKPKEAKEIKSSEEQDKIDRHRQRVKLGLLKYINKKQGPVELAELHEFSERRYLVGHQSFSQLMEELVDGKLLDFDWEKSEAVLSVKGSEFIAKEG